MITDQVVTLLSNGQALTATQLATHIPELAGQPYGESVLRLLLRLDRRFRQHEGRWLLIAGVSDPDQLILKALQSYFQIHTRGELLEHLVPAIANQTGQSPNEIKRIILQTYRQVGSMVLNQPKERN